VGLGRRYIITTTALLVVETISHHMMVADPARQLDRAYLK